ncbi:MAG: alcohol dehydrogenase catalytic domain-containing protein, partial [Limisphaerales bacterium]
MAKEGNAAILAEAGKAVTMETITIDSPGYGEVMVKLTASGVCHTDLHVKNMNGMGMKFPILLGHEGAGIVEEVGEGVTHLQPGDPVVIA